MHQCLQIDELLSAITVHIYDPREYETGVDDLVCMSLTCRNFYEAAMNRRWSILPSLRPLIRCLPEDTWEMTYDDDLDEFEVKIIRPPLPHEWERFDHHARRVRKLDLVSQSNTNPYEYQKTVDDSCYEILKEHYPHASVLPNLRILEYTDYEGTLRSYLHMFMPSSLRYIEYRLPCALGAIQVLECARDHAPNIWTLEGGAMWIKLNVSEPPLLARLTKAVCGLHNLTRFQLCVPYEGGALVHLASLPNLSEFTCAVNHLNCQSLTSSKSPTFSNLKHLEVWGANQDDGPRHIAHFLRSIRPHTLRRLDVFAYTTPRFDLLDQLLDAISRFDTLNMLIFRFEHAETRPSPPPAPDSVLQHLETLRSLEHLYINDLPIDFTGPGLNRLAKMWPSIINIDMARCSAPSSQIRLCDLLPFARYSSHLESLRIDVPQWQVMPPREKFGDEEHLREALSQVSSFVSPLQYLHAGELESDDLSPDVVTQIATFLLDFFPSARIDEKPLLRASSVSFRQLLDNPPRIRKERRRLEKLRQQEEAAEIEMVGVEESLG